MTKATFLAILQEEGLDRFEASGLWEAEQHLRERGAGVVDIEALREFVREALPNFLRLRELQKARGVTHRPEEP